MSKPLYGCQFEECATEVSYPADMLRLHNGEPICEFCYDFCDITDDMVLTRDEHGDPDEVRRFNDLPPFVPAHDQRIAELVAERDRLREALKTIHDANPINTYVCEIAERALAGGEKEQ